MARGSGTATKMRLLPLIAATYFMVSGGPYGLEDIIGKAGYGRALLILMLVPLLWSLPTSLMVGELASAIPCEGGFYQWVRRAMGPFWGFQEAWLSLASSIFDMAIYPTTFVLYLSHIAPVLTQGSRGLLLKLAIVAISATWNLRGAVAVGRGSQRMMAVSLSPFVVLIALALWHGLRHGIAPSSGGPPAQVDLAGAILVALWNYMGWDNASTIAQEVEDPQRNYPRAMLSSATVVMFVYTLPLAAVWLAGIPSVRFSTGAWVDAGMRLGGSLLALTVVLAGSLDGLGTFNALTLSLTRLPYAMAEDGLLPRILTLRWANGVPWVSVLACSLGWALALSFTFERLIAIDLVLYGAALMLEFVALVALRLREPAMPRPYRVPGGIGATIAIGIGPALLIVFALWAARDERVAGLPALAFATMVALAGPLVYLLMTSVARRRQQKDKGR
ncbi:APC family permease [Edaphobacter bradus]|uniref:APC family permease n=1 Tax=Edaphobacter bradus TaxID=2259016 RepID=UPI0021E02E8A|nr:APC family permease [Edaphobacter bradus]